MLQARAEAAALKQKLRLAEAATEREAKLARDEMRRIAVASRAETSRAERPRTSAPVDRPSSVAVAAERKEVEKREAKVRAELNAGRVREAQLRRVLDEQRTLAAERLGRLRTLLVPTRLSRDLQPRRLGCGS